MMPTPGGGATALVVAAQRTFATAVEGVEGHTRLKEALMAMQAGEVRGDVSHVLALLEGVAAPESRLLTYEEVAADLKAERRDGWFLRLGGRDVGAPGLKELARLFAPPLRTTDLSHRLVFLDLSNNYITSYGADFGPLRDLLFQLTKFPAFTALMLHGNALLHEGAVHLSRFLRNTGGEAGSLRYLDLSRCSLGDRGAAALYAAFCVDHDFRADMLALDEEGGAAAEAGSVGPVAAVPPASAAPAGVVVAPAPSQELTGGGKEADDEGASAKEDAPSTLPPARPTSAGNALGFGSGGSVSATGHAAMGALASRPKSALRSKMAAATAAKPSAPTAAAPATVITPRTGDAPHTSLVWLDLSTNNLGGYGYDPLPGGRLISAVVENLPRLTYLNLSRNRLTRSIMALLNAALEVNKSLHTLVLDGNGIDAAPAVAMAEVLTLHPSMTHLSLRFNAIRSDGAVGFAKLLSTTPRTRLASLDVRDNYIGDRGTRALLRAMGVVDTAAVGDGGGVGTEAGSEEGVPPLPPTTGRTPRGSGRGGEEEGEEPPMPPPGSGVILAGSGAAALLALRRQQQARAVKLGLAPTDVPQPTSPLPAPAPLEHVSVTSDGTVIQATTSASEGAPHAAGGGDALTAPNPSRLVRLDAEVCSAVFATMVASAAAGGVTATAPAVDAAAVGVGAGARETKGDD